uniref:Uncharacterized protein MANES_05G174500 n=1 Tax=Rhizophora mucronata TaxID=61149 RepID=A0A2P2MEJ4_RHIMU
MTEKYNCFPNINSSQQKQRQYIRRKILSSASKLASHQYEKGKHVPINMYSNLPYIISTTRSQLHPLNFTMYQTEFVSSIVV